ncbi:hypothetical protein [Streptomyces sp. NPDC093097]|uniref:hypothetical protein n=1 Tax=Streptomyces sp. NPDC093097 TaxID=3366027 RepID=UPI003814D41F
MLRLRRPLNATSTGRFGAQAIASGSTRLRPPIAEAARQNLRLAFTVRMNKTGYLHSSSSRTDSPGIRRDVIQRTDHTEERSYGSAAIHQWPTETGRIDPAAHITHLEIRTWRPRRPDHR